MKDIKIKYTAQIEMFWEAELLIIMILLLIRFLANVDPIDFARATEGLNPEETLFVVNSKTFTTAETMLNARSCR